MLYLFIKKLYLRHEKPIILVINNSYFVSKQQVVFRSFLHQGSQPTTRKGWDISQSGNPIPYIYLLMFLQCGISFLLTIRLKCRERNIYRGKLGYSSKILTYILLAKVQERKTGSKRSTLEWSCYFSFFIYNYMQIIDIY